MTEFEYDCYKKKTIARSASHKKNGRKSKKCSLSTDYMTDREWNERCGAVMSYQIGKPMIWADFCKLPKDLMEEYLNNLIDQYDANMRCLSGMFGVSTATITRFIKKENLGVEFKRGRHPAGLKESAFNQFLIGDVASDSYREESKESIKSASDDEIQCDDVSFCENSDDQNGDELTKLEGFTLSFSGRIDVEMVSNSLRYILGKGTNARLRITCELV